ncbi:MAG: HAD family hydrolase [Clostridia bacterium]
MDKHQTVIAIIYDFDKTLCTKDMQEYSFIPRLKMHPSEFWAEARELAEKNKMDSVLAYLYLMLKNAAKAGQRVWREDFVELGRHLEFFSGVKEWFALIEEAAKSYGATIEHYIISSGLREIIEGSEIFANFKEVFACEFLYEENGGASWAKNAVNYTTKTQFLFRINKGILDISEDDKLNNYTPEEERRIPFRNMIYIGDGLTDVPCMKLVKSNGGCSLAVYPQGEKGRVKDLLLHERVDFIAAADYTKGGELYEIIKDVVRKMSVHDQLFAKSSRQLKMLGVKDGKQE